MPCLFFLILQIGELAKAAPELIHELGGWPPVLTGALLACLTILGTAWAPVYAILSVMKGHEREREAIQKAEEKRRLEVSQAEEKRREADREARIEEAREHREGQQAIAAALDRSTEQQQVLSQTIAAGQGEISRLSQQNDEANAKLGRVETKLGLVLDRTKRNGSGS